MRLGFLLGLVCSMCYMACVPPSNEIKTDISIELSDANFKRIKTFQDEQQVDSLLTFFDHTDPSYRYLAALAFGSIKDSSIIDSLGQLLRDPVDEVRAAAAFAMGQTGGTNSETLLINAFSREDTAGNYKLANRAILEAIGKCGTSEMLQSLSTVSTYLPKDTFLLEGQSWGIYRFALRGITVPEGTELMLSYIQEDKYPEQVRLIAANYLSRARTIKLDSIAGQLIADVMTNESNPNIRMALAIALGKVKSDGALAALILQYGRDEDYRVKCNIISALGNYNYASAQAVAIQSLKDPQMAVARRGVQYFLDHGIADDATFYWRTAKDSLPWPIQVGMYQAANRHLPPFFVDYRDAMNAELRQRMRESTSLYEQAAIIMALAEFPWNYRFLYREGFKAESPIIRTATMNALASISDRRDFRGYFSGSYRTVRKEMVSYFQEAMRSGDPAMIAVAAAALRNERLGYANHIDSIGLFIETLEQLELPKTIETYNELQKTIAFFKEEVEPEPRKPAHNHPIDWAMLNPVSDAQKAVINTDEGEIVLELLVEEAPATVANFVALARQGFYENKTFHRVVPNFVIQGGCPRGDGYGSLDYTIRSELSPIHYDQEGYVGMASSGNHTECTQFFITHSPTPHLDGNYTIFARVDSGMEIVHQVQVGNRINNITFK
jgi:cyclophilin family peptidyl-prolyl cis-trans isomerase/HEAT repeat protein